MSLAELRENVEALATDDGEFFVVCGRTGERPFPAAGKRFSDRPSARQAVRTTEQYRATLRQYDPALPKYDPIVCQTAEPLVTEHLADPRTERV